MIGYTKEELSKARLDLEDIPLDMDILEVYTGLSVLDYWNYDFSSWGGNPVVTRNCIIRYINFFYSKELTCISDKYKDYHQRKAECARLAKFYYDPSTLEFNPDVKNMLNGNNVIVNRMIISFLRHNYETEWSAYCYSLDMFYKKMSDDAAAMAEGSLHEKPSVKDAKEFALFSKQLQEMRLDLLNHDKSKEISMALLISVEEDRLNLLPEHRAKRTRDGVSPLKDFDFYAPKYKNS